MQFEFYVLNYDCNRKEVINYNIFNNMIVQEWTEKAVKKYLRNPKKFSYTPFGRDAKTVYGFDALVKEINAIIMNQEWNRREYEISVSDAFEDDITKLEKWDCYQQVKPNIPIIARECIYQYKQQKKITNTTRN